MNDEQAIRGLIDEWMDATRQGSSDRLKPLMREDVVFLTPGMPEMTGRDVFLAAFEQGLAQFQIEPQADIQEIHVSGDIAWVWNRLRVEIRPLSGGSVRVRSGSALSILQKNADGTWQFVRDANLLTLEQ